MKAPKEKIILDLRCMRKGKNGPSRFAYEMLNALMSNNSLNEYLVLIHPEWQNEIQFKKNFQPHFTTKSFLCPWDFAFIIYIAVIFKATIYFSTSFITPVFTGTGKRMATVHDLINLTLPEYYEHYGRCYAALAKKYLQFMTWITIRLSDKLITVSNFSKKQITEYYNVKPEMIEVVYNGVSTKLGPRPLTKKTQNRLKIKKPYILGLSNFKGYKNNKCLLKAYADLKNSGCDEHLVLFGKYPVEKSKRIINEVIGRELAKQVCIIGIVDENELSEVYSEADIFIFPSLAEGFGIPVIEAMACGTPVVASRAGSLPEICGDAALYINPRKYRELSLAIKKILDEPKLRMFLTKKGYERIMNFAWKDSAIKLMNILEDQY